MTILTTKLHIPPARPNLVARPRLITRLNEGLTRPLTLISAPPGFGKTTLVTPWLEQQPLPAAWYSLDERDNDLARFLAYFVAALETVQPEIGRQALNRLRSRRRPPLESLMTLLSNDIAAIPRDFILVLDDYHLVELQVIHEAMAFLLDHLPPPMHLVIASRADPPFPLTRLRARGQLVELRAPDLRFSPDEAAAFLNQGMGLSLTPEQVAALDERAEGWIAGLQLAALSMQGHENVAGFISAFAGSHGFVLDYLAEEVLQRQTPEILTFLLQTSLLDHMNAALTDAVTGRDDSVQILAQLEKANLFLVSLDDARQWYRYHHLFDDLLQSRLQESHPEQVAELHRKASAWYEQNGFVNGAVDHALAAGDLERAAHLIELAAPTLLIRSEDRTLRTWIAALPQDLIHAHHSLGVWYATAEAGAGNFELAEAHLAQVDDTQLAPLARGVAALMRATIALFHSDLPHAIESARKALTDAGASTAASTGPEAELSSLTSVFLAMLLAEAEIAAGKLRDAVATYLRELEIRKSTAHANFMTVFIGYVHVRLAEQYYEWNELDVAAHHTSQGLEICRAERNEEFESYALSALAQIKQAQGDYANAIELGNQAMALGRKRNVASELRMLAARQVRILLQQNRIDDAGQIAREMPLAEQAPWFMQGALVPISRARVLIAQREFDRAAQMLEPLCQQAQAESQTGRLIEGMALLSLARQGQGETAKARTALACALSLGEPEGYVRTFVDLGESMEQLLKVYRLQVTGSTVSEEYVMKLLISFPAVNHAGQLSNFQPSNVQPSNLQHIPEPLSERELAVLRLIAEGLTNQEIADRLIVALSTVKTHINNIYGKLGAANRTQALSRARELKLL